MPHRSLHAPPPVGVNQDVQPGGRDGEESARWLFVDTRRLDTRDAPLEELVVDAGHDGLALEGDGRLVWDGWMDG